MDWSCSRRDPGVGNYEPGATPARDAWGMARINSDNQPLQNHHNETMALIAARREEYLAMLQKRRAGPDATVPL